MDSSMVMLYVRPDRPFFMEIRNIAIIAQVDVATTDGRSSLTTSRFSVLSYTGKLPFSRPLSHQRAQ